MICMDLDALASKVVNLLPESKERVLASGLLVAAAHILQSHSSPVQTQSMPSDNGSNLNVADIANAIAQRMGSPPPGQQSPGRSLAKEWGGSLPRLSTTTKAKPKAKPKDSIAKPKPNIPIVPSKVSCPSCGDPVGDHPSDKNFEIDAQQRAVVILCDQTRVRCVKTDL